MTLVMQARIHPYFPYIHVAVSAKVHLFCPAPGHTLSAPLPAVEIHMCDVFR
jgi:hypothetical protein